jgi:hypothetical protein
MGFGEIYVVKIGFRELVLVTAQGHEANPKSANLLLKGRGASVELREAPGFWGLEINFRSFFCWRPVVRPGNQRQIFTRLHVALRAQLLFASDLRC